MARFSHKLTAIKRRFCLALFNLLDMEGVVKWLDTTSWIMLGEAPKVTQVVGSPAEVAAVTLPDPNRVAYLTQTTLSLDVDARHYCRAPKTLPQHR